MRDISEIFDPLAAERSDADFKMPENVAFVHKKRNWYLPFVLNQALSANQGKGIALLGDRGAFESAPPSVTCFEVDELAGGERAREFSRIYRHRSTNTQRFTLQNILRWFYVHEYMGRHRIDTILHLDTDVLLYSSLATIRQAYKQQFSGKSCGLVIPEIYASRHAEPTYWAAVGHISVWTHESLGQFCDFVIESTKDKHYGRLYDEKWAWHKEVSGIPGGVSDMTYLYFFWLANKNKIVNLAESCGDGVFDLAFGDGINNYDDEYAVSEEQTKRLVFRSNMPYFVRKSDGALIRVHAVHFQGSSNKKYIRAYYRGGRLSLRKTQFVGLLMRGWRRIGR